MELIYFISGILTVGVVYGVRLLSKVKSSHTELLAKYQSHSNISSIRYSEMGDMIEEMKVYVGDIQGKLSKDSYKETVKLNSRKDLLIYCYRVAGTVGIMMAKILKVYKKSSLRSAIDLGIAMQLTNISRDVIEDSKNNRFYIDENFEKRSQTKCSMTTWAENNCWLAAALEQAALLAKLSPKE